MKLLLTNDDGIFAKGLLALYEVLSENNQVDVIAPDRERSAVGHGITLNDPIRAEKIQTGSGYSGIAVSGTPADCIKLGILELLSEKPDLVISGINPGANVGVNINYSGTVAAAREASLYGIPAIAVSIDSRSPKHYREAALFISMLVPKLMNNGLPFGTFLNVNIPDLPMEGGPNVVISKQGVSFPEEYIEKKIDPRNRPYYWQGCEADPEFTSPEIDGAALRKNYVSITPIKCDMTDYEVWDYLKQWLL